MKKLRLLCSAYLRWLMLSISYVFPLFRLQSKRLRILFYHGIDDVDFPVAVFKQQLAYIQTRFETVHMQDLPALRQANFKTASGKPPLILTFDDGLKNNAQIVAPLIRQYQLKATFYLLSDLPDNQAVSMLWNHELKCRLQLMASDERQSYLKSKSLAQFIQHYKQQPAAHYFALLAKLRKRQPKPRYTETMRQQYQLMSLNEAQQLPTCIEIGCHTKNHKILTQVTDDELKIEMVQAKTDMEQQLNRHITHFCYPNGNYNQAARHYAEQHYDTAVTTDEGFVTQSSDLYTLARIPAAANMRDFVFRLLRPTA